MRSLIDWWLDLSRVQRFMLCGAILGAALVVLLAFDRVWITGWAAGGVLFVLTAFGIGEDKPL